MKKAPGERKAWLMSMDIGKQSFRAGRMNDAVNAFQQATKLLPGRIEGWVNLGSALVETGRYESAVAALGRATDINPKLAAAHMLLGDAFRLLGDFKVALHSYRRAVALQRSPLTLNKLACGLRVEGQRDEAGALYREAMGLDPRFSLARVNFATLQIELGEFETAQTLLNELHGQALPPPERDEVVSSQRALDEYFRLRDALGALATQENPAPLRTALLQMPAAALAVDELALGKIRRYIRWAAACDAAPSDITGILPTDWPLIEALFMIPLIDTPQQFLDIQAQLGQRESATGDLAESLVMEAAIEAARNCRDEMSDPALAELHLRHWHALATRGMDGFLPGHFKYTQNWSTRYPTLKRVDPALTSGTFRQFTTELYAALQPGLLRATVAFIGFLDLHPFADGNGRVALTWLNRELEWAGLMPALLPRNLSMKGEAGGRVKQVRESSGDLSGLLDVIRSAQLYAVEFCAALQSRH